MRDIAICFVVAIGLIAIFGPISVLAAKWVARMGQNAP